MRAGRRSAYPRLSAAEGWLLSAATQSRPVAQAAWERWRSRCAVETAGPKSQALFPMIYANLIEELGGPDATLLKGVYRRTWYANQLALAQVKPLLEHFAAQGMPVLLLNDASVVAGHYPDIGHRVIRCIDVLVHRYDMQGGVTAATAAGWQAQTSESFGTPTSLSVTAFSGADGRTLRVWANLLAAEPQEDTDARVWQTARSIQINDQDVSTLGPVEQLLCLSADAFREREPSLYLYADARRLLHSLDSTSDWTRLIWQAQRYEHILPLRHMLAFLRTALGVDLPAWVLPALHKMAISHAELRQFHQACDTGPLRLKSLCLRWLMPVRPLEAER